MTALGLCLLDELGALISLVTKESFSINTATKLASDFSSSIAKLRKEDAQSGELRSKSANSFTGEIPLGSSFKCCYQLFGEVYVMAFGLVVDPPLCCKRIVDAGISALGNLLKQEVTSSHIQKRYGDIYWILDRILQEEETDYSVKVDDIDRIRLWPNIKHDFDIRNKVYSQLDNVDFFLPMNVSRLVVAHSVKPFGDAFKCGDGETGILLPAPVASPLLPVEVSFLEQGMDEASFGFEANFDDVFVEAPIQSLRSITELVGEQAPPFPSRKASLARFDLSNKLSQEKSLDRESKKETSSDKINIKNFSPSLNNPYSEKKIALPFSGGKHEASKSKTLTTTRADLYGVVNMPASQDPFSEKYGTQSNAEQARAGKQSIVAPSQRRKSMDQGAYYSGSNSPSSVKSTIGVSPSSLKSRKFSEMPLSQPYSNPSSPPTSLFSNSMRSSHLERTEPVASKTAETSTPPSTKQTQKSPNEKTKAPASSSENSSRTANRAGTVYTTSPTKTEVPAVNPQRASFDAGLLTKSYQPPPNVLIDDLVGFGDSLPPKPSSSTSSSKGTTGGYVSTNQDLLLFMDDITTPTAPSTVAPGDILKPQSQSTDTSLGLSTGFDSKATLDLLKPETNDLFSSSSRSVNEKAEYLSQTTSSVPLNSTSLFESKTGSFDSNLSSSLFSNTSTSFGTTFSNTNEFSASSGTQPTQPFATAFTQSNEFGGSAPLQTSFFDAKAQPQTFETSFSSSTNSANQQGTSFFGSTSQSQLFESSVSLSSQSSYSHLTHQLDVSMQGSNTGSSSVPTAFLASQIRVAISETVNANYVGGKSETLSVMGQIGFSFPNVAKYPLPKSFVFQIKGYEKFESAQPNPTFLQSMENGKYLFTCADYSRFDPAKPLTIIRYKLKQEFNLEMVRVAPVWKKDALHSSIMIMCAVNPALKFNLDDFSVTLGYVGDVKNAILQPTDGVWSKEENKVTWKIPSFQPTSPKTKLYARFDHTGTFQANPLAIKFHSKHNLVSGCLVESENGDAFRVGLSQVNTGKFEASGS